MNFSFILNDTVVLGTVITGGEQQGTSGGAGTEIGTGGENGAGGQQGGAGGLFSPMMILIWVGMFAAMYFFLFRPQKKREKQAKEMQESLRVGDSILTSGGIYGKIAGVGTDAFLIEFGENRGVRVWIRKSDVLGVKEPVTTPPVEKIEEVKEKK